MATLRRFLPSDMYNKLRISVEAEDYTDMNVGQILEALSRFIRSNRNIAMDRIPFEQRQQLEGKDFEVVLIAIQQLAENSDLCEDHCQDFTKACVGLRIATKHASGKRDTESKTKYYNVVKVVDVCRTEEYINKKE